MSHPYRPPLARRRAALQLLAVALLATGGLVALDGRPVAAFDAPCGPGKPFVRMWENVGFEGDTVVLCANKDNFLYILNGRDCDSPREGSAGQTWADCPGALYVNVSGTYACFYTDRWYYGSRLRVSGAQQVNLAGTLWNNNLESFRFTSSGTC